MFPLHSQTAWHIASGRQFIKTEEMKAHKKRPGRLAGGMAMMLLCTLLLSCNNDDFLGNGNATESYDYICFGISSDKDVPTRGYAVSNEHGYTSDRFVLRSDNSADTLCVRTIVSDVIDVSGFDGEQILTRGKPVANGDFYDKFHVRAYRTKGETPVDNQFYMNEYATNNGSVWITDNIYYWPGEEHNFKFYAWAPTDVSSLITPPTPQDALFTYTVPQEATAQKDIVVAAPTREIQGDADSAVALNFEHVCTAVSFAVGNIQPDTIKSIALKGVKSAGTYDMSTRLWTLDDTTADFSQELNKYISGSETEITNAEGTFMMLPQELPSGAYVEVVVCDANNKQRTLSASIGNTEWEMGKHVTYKLSITPEYGINIEVPTEAQDAHYITFPITVNVEDYDGAWTLTSNFTNDVYFTPTQTDLQKQGYWIDDDKGSSTISGSGSGSFLYYVYVTENVGEASRDIEFKVTPTATASATSAIATVEQLCPSWNGALGCERVEDGDYPWGFYWDDDFKLVYDMKKCSDSDRQDISRYIRWTKTLHSLFPTWFPTDISYVDHAYEGGFFGSLGSMTDSVTINFNKLDVANIALHGDSGVVNTKELINFQGISQVADIIERIQNCSGYTVKTYGNGMLNPERYAARACARLNRYKKQVASTGEETAVIEDEDLVWYLPARNEVAALNDKDYPLNGDYWTSTAAPTGNKQAYKYTAGQNSADDLENRNISHHVRAVRSKP